MSVPKGWRECKLGDVLKKLKDGTHFSPKIKGGDFKYITSKNIRMGYLDLSNVQYIDEEQHKKIFHSSPVIYGDILLTKDGANAGNSCLNSLHEEFSLLSSVAILSGRIDELDNIFLLNLLMYDKTQAIIKSEVTGQAITRLTLAQIGLLKFLLPPLAEQQKIAAILSTWDRAITAVDKLLENAKQQKKALMQQLLTGKKRLPGFSGEWEEVFLYKIADIDPENLIALTDKTYTFNYISLENINEGKLLGYHATTFKNAPSRARRIIHKMDLLIATVRPNLKSHLFFQEEHGEWVCSTGFCVVRCKQDKANPHYIFQHFFAKYINQQIDKAVTGSNYPAISSSDVRNLSIPYPPLVEQTAIARVLTTADKEIQALSRKAALLRQEKRALMQQLLTGKKRGRVEASHAV